MLVRATVSFAGALTMAINEVRDLEDSEPLTDLLDCGYVVSVEVKEEKSDATKRDYPRRGKAVSKD